MQVAQLQRHRRLLDEGGFLAHGVHTAHVQLGAANRKHHTGQATAGAHIQQAHPPALHRTTLRQLRQMATQGQHSGQAVEQVVGQHFLRVAHGRQVVDLVPLLQQGQKLHQLRKLRGGQLQPHRSRTFLQACLQGFGGGCTHAATSPSACAAFKAKSLKPPFFRCTMSSEMAAGVIPVMRDAWPSVSGRWRVSAWRASMLRAVTCM